MGNSLDDFCLDNRPVKNLVPFMIFSNDKKNITFDNNNKLYFPLYKLYTNINMMNR